MPTKYERAISAGYSHEEIIKFLQPKIDKALSTGYSLQEINDYLGIKVPTPEIPKPDSLQTSTIEQSDTSNLQMADFSQPVDNSRTTLDNNIEVSTQMQDISRIANIQEPAQKIDPKYFTPKENWIYPFERLGAIGEKAIFGVGGFLPEVAKTGAGVFGKNTKLYQWLDNFTKFYEQPEKYGIISPRVSEKQAQRRLASFQAGTAWGIANDVFEAGTDLAGLLVQLNLIGKINPQSSILFKDKLTRISEHATKIGIHRLISDNGETQDRIQSAITMIGYNITPYIAGSFGLSAIPSVTIDTALNSILSSPNYIKAMKEDIKKNGTVTQDFWISVIPDMVMNIGMALSTRGRTKEQSDQIKNQKKFNKQIKAFADAKGVDTKEVLQTIKDIQKAFDEAEVKDITKDLKEPTAEEQFIKTGGEVKEEPSKDYAKLHEENKVKFPYREGKANNQFNKLKKKFNKAVAEGRIEEAQRTLDKLIPYVKKLEENAVFSPVKMKNINLKIEAMKAKLEEKPIIEEEVKVEAPEKVEEVTPKEEVKSEQPLVEEKEEPKVKSTQAKYVRTSKGVFKVESETKKSWLFTDGTRANKSAKGNRETSQADFLRYGKLKGKKGRDRGKTIPTKGIDWSLWPALDIIRHKQTTDKELKDLYIGIKPLFSEKGMGMDDLIAEVNSDQNFVDRYGKIEKDTEVFKDILKLEIQERYEGKERSATIKDAEERYGKELEEAEMAEKEFQDFMDENVKNATKTNETELEFGDKVTFIDPYTGKSHTGVVVSKEDGTYIQNDVTEKVEDFGFIWTTKIEKATKEEIQDKQSDFEEDVPFLTKEEINNENIKKMQSKEFENVLNNESIGGNAGKNSAGVNFIINEEGLVVAIGNYQNLPQKIKDGIDNGTLLSPIVRVTFENIRMSGNRIYKIEFYQSPIHPDQKLNNAQKEAMSNLENLMNKKADFEEMNEDVGELEQQRLIDERSKFEKDLAKKDKKAVQDEILEAPEVKVKKEKVEKPKVETEGKSIEELRKEQEAKNKKSAVQEDMFDEFAGQKKLNLEEEIIDDAFKVDTTPKSWHIKETELSNVELLDNKNNTFRIDVREETANSTGAKPVKIYTIYERKNGKRKFVKIVETASLYKANEYISEYSKTVSPFQIEIEKPKPQKKVKPKEKSQSNEEIISSVMGKKAAEEYKNIKPSPFTPEENHILKAYGASNLPDKVQKAILAKDKALSLLDAKMDDAEVNGDIDAMSSIAKQIKAKKGEINKLVKDKIVDLNAGLPIKTFKKIIDDLTNTVLRMGIDPAKILRKKLGKDITTRTFKILNNPEWQRYNFDKQKIEGTDKTFDQLEEYFGHFSKKERDAFNAVMYGNPTTPVGKAERLSMKKNLPPILNNPALAEQIKQIADYVNAYRKEVFKDKDLTDFEDYFYGIYKDKGNNTVKNFIGTYKRTQRFNKKKTVDTIADALAFGLELKNNNLVTNLKQELSAIAYYESIDMLKQSFLNDRNNPLYMKKNIPASLQRLLRATGKGEEDKFVNYSINEMGKKKFQGKVNTWFRSRPEYDKSVKVPFNKRVEILRDDYNDIQDKLSAHWKKIEQPTFKSYLFEPSLADFVNNLTSTNRVTNENPLFKIPTTKGNYINVSPIGALRRFNLFNQTLKFLLSGFHQINVSAQAVADTRVKDMFGKNNGFLSMLKSLKDIPEDVKNSPIFKRYVQLGGQGESSLQTAAQREMKRFLIKINSEEAKILKEEGKQGKALLSGIADKTIGLPFEYVNWLFGKFIPRLKFYKTMYEKNANEARLGRELTDSEFQDVIKEGQNFYGLMNERIFGRSASEISALRLIYLAPGYAEGNLRTIYDGMFQYEKEGVKVGDRSRRNIINSLLLKLTFATIGTYVLTGHAPEPPETVTDVRDWWKIDTGFKDKNGNKIMIDAMTYDKDYFNFIFAPTLEAIKNKDVSKIPEGVGNAVWSRLQGMKAPSVDMILDLMDLARGKKILDWKNDSLVDVRDTKIQKILKIIAYESKFTEPFIVSNIKKSQQDEISKELAIVTALLGLRFTRDEETKEEYKIWQTIYEYKDAKEELWSELWKVPEPREKLQQYNEAIERLYSSDLIKNYLKRGTTDISAKELEEDKIDLLIDEKQLLANKMGELTTFKMIDLPERKKRLISYLERFDIKTYKEAEDLLIYYFEDHKIGVKKAREHLGMLQEVYGEK